jgi:serine/threonine-protein phosphatase 5
LSFDFTIDIQIFLPHRVFLLRGNHESKYCTSIYGFEQEVMAKYGGQGQMVYRKCLRCFEGLPLASIIADRVYTAHGGLFRAVVTAAPKKQKGKKKSRKIAMDMSTSMKLGSLDELDRARRTVLDPPWNGANLIPGDVLWSDPSNKPGLSPNKDRGIGLLWGPDMTEEFLYKYQMKVCHKIYVFIYFCKVSWIW